MSDIPFETEKSNALKIAKQLEYPEKVRQKLMSAETSHDITRILIQARHEV